MDDKFANLHRRLRVASAEVQRLAHKCKHAARFEAVKLEADLKMAQAELRAVRATMLEYLEN